MRLLHIDTSILGANSASRELSAAVVARLGHGTPNTRVTYRDLAAEPLGHLTGAHLAATQGAVPETAELQKDVAAGQAVLEEFLAADTVVIGAPMYNFTLPSQLKAWIDRIVVAGRTFRYGPNGVEGLAAGKRVIVLVSRGGYYGPGTPTEAAEHAQSYLRTVFGFIGVTDLEFIVAEGLQLGPEQRATAMQNATQAAAELKAA